MAETKFTKGPWKAFSENGVVEVQTQHRKKPIVKWTGFDASGWSLGKQIANAHLIAAAPELYEAALLAEQMITGQPSLSDIERTRDALCAALRKARGESQ